MSQLILDRGASYRNKFFARLVMGPYFLVFSLIAFVILITVVTLMFSTRQVTKGYVLSKLDDEHQVLITQSEQNEMRISQVRSLDYIKNSESIGHMVSPDQIVFMGTDTAIASR
jgi:hypothetical protein